MPENHRINTQPATDPKRVKWVKILNALDTDRKHPAQLGTPLRGVLVKVLKTLRGD